MGAYLQLVRGGERGLRIGQRLDRLRHARRQHRRNVRAPRRGRRGASAQRAQLRLKRLRCARAQVTHTGLTLTLNLPSLIRACCRVDSAQVLSLVDGCQKARHVCPGWRSLS